MAETIQDRIDYTKKRIEELDAELKSMGDDHPRYNRTWDVRADARRDLRILEMELKK